MPPDPAEARYWIERIDRRLDTLSQDVSAVKLDVARQGDVNDATLAKVIKLELDRDAFVKTYTEDRKADGPALRLAKGIRYVSIALSASTFTAFIGAAAAWLFGLLEKHK